MGAIKAEMIFLMDIILTALLWGHAFGMSLQLILRFFHYCRFRMVTLKRFLSIWYIECIEGVLRFIQCC